LQIRCYCTRIKFRKRTPEMKGFSQKTKYQIFLLIFFAGIFLPAKVYCAPADSLSFRFEVTNSSKSSYEIGDTVKFLLTATQAGKVCSDGVQRSRLFAKGIKITRQSEWKETGQGCWLKQIETVITGNSKNNWQITAFRKTDKGEIAETFTLKQTTK
jgi:hypothetical protein